MRVTQKLAKRTLKITRLWVPESSRGAAGAQAVCNPTAWPRVHRWAHCRAVRPGMRTMVLAQNSPPGHLNRRVGAIGKIYSI